MKGKFNIKDSYTYSHSDCNEEDFFTDISLNEIEHDICRLQTFSQEEHRSLARKVYKKIQDRIRRIKDGSEKAHLKSLGLMIDMKMKSI